MEIDPRREGNRRHDIKKIEMKKRKEKRVGKEETRQGKKRLRVPKSEAPACFFFFLFFPFPSS
jgi:hypothetical protein